MRIAIIGSGVSGLVAAHYLGPVHEVTVFEAASRLGGHAHTVDVDDDGSPLAVDTGFLVFNPNTYPNFLRLLSELGVEFAETDMSFSVSSARRDFEYSSRNLSALYSQRKHVLNPRFHRMVWDILRFYREAPELLRGDDEVPLAQWLRSKGFSDPFMDDHLTPMVRAVWSANRHVLETFPARFLVRFFHNHGFLSAAEQPRWLTIPGGSRRYVNAIRERFRGEIRLSCPVQRVTRQEGGVQVQPLGAQVERFDHVVMACHSDQALRLLGDASPLEQELLGALPYQPNEAVLHRDRSIMPRRRRAWASWNVHLDDAGANGACVTYWLNSLQPLVTRNDYFVTLNHTGAIDPSKVIRVFAYDHPIFGLRGVAAQKRHAELIDYQNTSYCGAYWRNGFHEDGVVSALAVCERLGCSAATKAA